MMLVLKLEEVLGRIRELSNLNGVRLILIFGSVARGDYRPDSDVDVLLVANNPSEVRRKAREISSEIFAETGVPVSVITVSPEDYERSSNLLIRRAKREGFILWKG